MSTSPVSTPVRYEHLDRLESQSVYIMREAFAKFENLAMLWSIGKDSNVMMWLARKAFLGKVPFPVVDVESKTDYLKQNYGNYVQALKNVKYAVKRDAASKNDFETELSKCLVEAK